MGSLNIWRFQNANFFAFVTKTQFEGMSNIFSCMTFAGLVIFKQKFRKCSHPGCTLFFWSKQHTVNFVAQRAQETKHRTSVRSSTRLPFGIEQGSRTAFWNPMLLPSGPEKNWPENIALSHSFQPIFGNSDELKLASTLK